VATLSITLKLMRTTNTMTVSLSPAMTKELERVRKAEHRTRSELIREALRQYIESRSPSVMPAKAEFAAIRRGRAAFARGDYVSLTALEHDLETPGDRTGARRVAKAAGQKSGTR